MNQIFISYSRKDVEFARRLTESFAAQDMESWVDWEDIPPSVDWVKEIEKGIEETDFFVFIVSPDSIRSDACAQEVAHAVLNGKRIVPVVARDIDVKEVPSTISHLNWTFFSRPLDKYEDVFEKLLTAIRTDYGWVQTHARLQVKALDWERNNHEDSFLLRGKDLADAEAQLIVNSEKNPRSTDLQRQYIIKSAEVEKEQIESQRAKELQLELEKRLGSRLRRLTYLLLGVFTVAYVVLFFWLYQVTSALAINSIQNQMLALVETAVCFVYGDEFGSFVNTYAYKDNSVYDTGYYNKLADYMHNVKNMNENINGAEIVLYTIIKSSKVDEYLIINSTDEAQDVTYKTTRRAHNTNVAQIAGLKKTVADMNITEDEFGIWISACSPILNSKGESVGALCSDFNAQFLEDTQKKVVTALVIAFLAIYPAMIVLVLYATRSLQKKRDDVIQK